jgi:hypothetical protein
MDKELRKEVRDWKVEIDDRLKALEAAVASQGVTSEVPAVDASKGKKTSSEPAVVEIQ